VIRLRSSLSRGGALFLALACIGSTGCITTSIANNVQYQNRLRAQEAARQRRMAALAPAAEAGNAKARVALANELLDDPVQDKTALQRAATRGCGAGPKATLEGLDPALKVANALEEAGQPEQARVWRARSVLDCRTSEPAALLWRAVPGRFYPDRHAESMAILLTRDAESIAKARAAVPPEEFAAAERLAAELQQQVAASERDYPAPPRKDKP